MQRLIINCQQQRKNRKHFHLGNFLVISESKQHVWLAAHGGGGRDLLPGVPLQPLLRHGHRGTRVLHTKLVSKPVYPFQALQTVFHTGHGHLDTMHHPDYILLVTGANLGLWVVSFITVGGFR